MISFLNETDENLRTPVGFFSVCIWTSLNEDVFVMNL